MKFNTKFTTHNFLVIVLLTIVGGCSGVKFSQWRFPYMYSVQQGNYISQNRLSAIKIGMNKDQVVAILGRPLSPFLFNHNSWQYIFQSYTNNTVDNHYTINLEFDKNSKLISLITKGNLFTK